MKDIKEYILEKQNLTFKRVNTPDEIVKRQNGKKTTMWYDDENAAFLYNIKNNQIIFSDTGESHQDIIDEMSKKDKKNWEMEKINSTTQMRYAMSWDAMNNEESFNKEKEKWEEEHKGSPTDYIYLGRVFYKERSLPIITWWNELSKSQFQEMNDDVLREFCNEFGFDYNKYSKKYKVVDNNGKIITLKVGGKVEVEERSEEYKNDVEQARNIHLATQKEKKEYFKLFKQERDRKNQEIYNKENTQHHTKVEHNFYFRTHNGKPYDGDSYHTNVKPLKEYLEK